MRTTQVRPRFDPETCAICGRTVLQGEQIDWFISPDNGRRPVCELCVPRAQRARWSREQVGGEATLQSRPSRPISGGWWKRARGDRQASQRNAGKSDHEHERRPQSKPLPPKGRATTGEAQPPRSFSAIPTTAQARLARGLELFNGSQFPRTIAGLSRSLELPKVAVTAIDDSNAIEIIVAWDITWYSYRVDLGDATEAVEVSGRGNDMIEIGDRVVEWNGSADAVGTLFLITPTDVASSDPALS